MKKIILIALLIFAFLGLIFIFFGKGTKNNVFNIPAQKTIDQNSEETAKTVKKGSGYKSAWVKVNDKNKLFLYSNLSDKNTSKELATKNFCAHLISGGFYDTQEKHIGLLVSDSDVISESQDNPFFNAYFSISEKGTVSITEYPTFSPRISLQTGPFLIKNSKVVSLNLEKDENARRLVLGISKDKTVVFLVIFDQSSSFLGPKLSELPGIISEINDNENLNLTDVINLDGGTHSAFISDIVSLSEASPIGSFFCIKP